MSAFDESSQLLQWTFTTKEISLLRNDAEERYANAEDGMKRIVYSLPDKSHLNRLEQSLHTLSSDRQLENDELVLLYFCTHIKQGCSINEKPNEKYVKIRRPWRVWCTSAVYFRRFYLNNSLRAHDPRLVMLACIFLAAKVETAFISAADLIAAELYKNCTLDAILTYELKLLEALKFQLKVLHPHNTSHALIADFKRVFQGGTGADGRPLPAIGEADRQTMRKWTQEAEESLDSMTLSSLVMRFSPSILALAAMLKTEPLGLPLSLEAYLALRFGAATAAMLEDARSVIVLLPQALRPLDNAHVKVLLQDLRKSSSWGSKRVATES